MRRLRSRLDSNGIPLLLAAGISLFLLICVCFVMNNHCRPRYGFTMRPAASHFVMGEQDHANTHYLYISAGDSPRIYIDNARIEGGLSGLDAVLDSLKPEETADTVLVLVADAAVPSAVLTGVADQVLMHGYICNIAGRPHLDHEAE